MPQPQACEHARAEQKHEDHAGEHRAAGAERDVPEYIEGADGIGKLTQPIQHDFGLRIGGW